MISLSRPLVVALPTLLLAAACSAAPDAPVTSAPEATATTPAPAPTDAAMSPVDAGPPVPMAPLAANTILVHKSPTCGCCAGWVEHLRANGFQVEVEETDDLAAVQSRVGVPVGKGSCHTAEVAGYFIEGHVPAADIRRLLAEKPDARGLTVPGMPLGSPGMEAPGNEQAYSVELVARDGSTTEFAKHGP